MSDNKVININETIVSFKELSQKIKEKIQQLKNFQIISKIASGTFGTVLFAIEELQNNLCIEFALKLITKKETKGDKNPEKEKIMKEFNLAKNLHHKHVVLVNGYTVLQLNKNNKAYVLLMENAKCDLRCLLNYIEKNIFRIRNKNDFEYIYQLSELLIKFIIIQLNQANFYFNSARLIHGDIKPGNILVTNNCLLKLCDFSKSKTIPYKNKTFKAEIGTSEYSSYECYSRNINIEEAGKSDVFSIGCILYKLQFKHNLIKFDLNEKVTQKTISKKINEGINKELNNEFYSEDMKNYSIKMINVYPKNRYSPKEALDNKWLHEDNETIKEINYINQLESNFKILFELQKHFKNIDSLKRRARYYID